MRSGDRRQTTRDESRSLSSGIGRAWSASAARSAAPPSRPPAPGRRWHGHPTERSRTQSRPGCLSVASRRLRLPRGALRTGELRARQSSVERTTWQFFVCAGKYSNPVHSGLAFSCGADQADDALSTTKTPSAPPAETSAEPVSPSKTWSRRGSKLTRTRSPGFGASAGGVRALRTCPAK